MISQTDTRFELSALQRDLDQLRARIAMQTTKNYSRLARIEGTIGGSDNTFSITFLDGTYTETAGVQTPTYTDRQSTPKGIAHNVSTPTTQISNGDIVIVDRISDRWWLSHIG